MPVQDPGPHARTYYAVTRTLRTGYRGNSCLQHHQRGAEGRVMHREGRNEIGPPDCPRNMAVPTAGSLRGFASLLSWCPEVPTCGTAARSTDEKRLAHTRCRADDANIAWRPCFWCRRCHQCLLEILAWSPGYRQSHGPNEAEHSLPCEHSQLCRRCSAVAHQHTPRPPLTPELVPCNPELIHQG